MTNFALLEKLGWQPFYQQQLSLDEWENAIPARVVDQHKSILAVTTETESLTINILPSMPNFVVGDWLLLNNENQFLRLLDRKTCFKRKAAGTQIKEQLISANIDTAFIVCSLNDDFNLNRLERYLSLVNEAEVEPIILLSKSDLVDDIETYTRQILGLDSHLIVAPVNCLDSASTEQLAPWLKPGSTIVVLGSSGVGKSTLINTLLGESKQSTASIRQDDSKGRHTTTSRSLLPLQSGALILDTPGMREIQLTDCKEGIAATFSDIEQLANDCRYKDCQHQSEPGCAVNQAVLNGKLEQRRLDNYLKLLKEDAINSASLAEKRAQDKALGKFYKRSLSESYKFKGRDSNN
ncbi:ribosome small subunit-dependent GTPase A [Aliikangiella marina]|uniref:Small ribosomal subunit biogenesis GTPase RsgA n=1 Tax=Aliikangiella marina TaxID=1712262 RepID=A0A545TJH8_9GAMM|nr:ribosome small subunit-dependent GTPase A [Aliikangiella marina]TQV77321.1 ribosome small subunit-dependent GTPase A [Aliikangiella marina]